MLKYIKILWIIILVSVIIPRVFAWVYFIELNPNSVQYNDPYKIKNNTNDKVFAPYSDINSKVTANLSNGTWNISFWEKLDKTYNLWWFTISNANYSWEVWNWWECKSWEQIRTVGCKRDNLDFVSESLCTETKPTLKQACWDNCFQIGWTKNNLINWKFNICESPTKPEESKCCDINSTNFINWTCNICQK